MGIFISRLLRLGRPVQDCQGIGFVVVDWLMAALADGRDDLVFTGVALAGRMLLDRADRNADVRNVVVLAPSAQVTLLAPDIIARLLAGRQPRSMTLWWFQHNPLPVDWDAQRQLVARFEEKT
ncbi:site-specific recombinase resolvase [Ralstonia pseudosolanacearum]|nr:site-specific recombinase resolvase [Ralstonia pseudosolanacearum]